MMSFRTGADPVAVSARTVGPQPLHRPREGTVDQTGVVSPDDTQCASSTATDEAPAARSFTTTLSYASCSASRNMNRTEEGAGKR